MLSLVKMVFQTSLRSNFKQHTGAINVQEFFRPKNIQLDITSASAIHLALIELGQAEQSPIMILDMNFTLRASANFSHGEQLDTSKNVVFVIVTTTTKIIPLEVFDKSIKNIEIK